MANKSENTNPSTTGGTLCSESENVGRGEGLSAPSPRHLFLPGPVISEPDELIKIPAPLPPARKDWNTEDVRSWIEQLEKCPPGRAGDGYAKDVNEFLNQYRRNRLWKEQAELCKRGQKAVVDYQKRRGS